MKKTHEDGREALFASTLSLDESDEVSVKKL